MTESFADILIIEYASYIFYGLFACLMFMSWYLCKVEASTFKDLTRWSIWPEIMFRFRDYTKRNFGKVHFVYYLTIFLLLVLVAMFGLQIFQLLKEVQPPLNYIIGIIGGGMFSLIAFMFYYMSKSEY